MRNPSFVMEMRIWSLNARNAGLCSINAESFAFSCLSFSASACVGIATDAARAAAGCGCCCAPSPGFVFARSRPPPCTTLGREAPEPSLVPSMTESGVLK
jgi:hypothetical protein